MPDDREVQVHLLPDLAPPGRLAGGVAVVIDVLRASTSIAAALANGARAVIPLESSDDVVARAKAFARGEVRLAGERRMRAIPGFDFGNSPREFTSEAVGGKTVLMCTTNGTGALTSVQGARDVVVASYVNFSAVAALLRSALRGGVETAIICAGGGRQFSLEDAACAGRFVHHATRRVTSVDLNDAAIAASLIHGKYGDNLMRLFDDSTHGRALRHAGFGDDLAVCGSVDAFPVVPVLHERQITKLGPERGR
jgi:2-phosphosulfolactate phosphatase